MKKVMSLLIALMLMGISVGCTKNIQPNASMFEVGIDELTDIQMNKSFKITGYLKNNYSNYQWEIAHGAGMFTYEIFDWEGNPIPQNNSLLLQKDIGYHKKLKPNEVYKNNGEGRRSKEFYEFIIDKPGQYKLKTKVEFGITYEQIKYEQELTNEFEFSVQ